MHFIEGYEVNGSGKLQEWQVFGVPKSQYSVYRTINNKFQGPPPSESLPAHVRRIWWWVIWKIWLHFQRAAKKKSKSGDPRKRDLKKGKISAGMIQWARELWIGVRVPRTPLTWCSCSSSTGGCVVSAPVWSKRRTMILPCFTRCANEKRSVTRFCSFPTRTSSNHPLPRSSLAAHPYTK